MQLFLYNITVCIGVCPMCVHIQEQKTPEN